MHSSLHYRTTHHTRRVLVAPQTISVSNTRRHGCGSSGGDDVAYFLTGQAHAVIKSGAPPICGRLTSSTPLSTIVPRSLELHLSRGFVVLTLVHALHHVLRVAVFKTGGQSPVDEDLRYRARWLIFCCASTQARPNLQLEITRCYNDLDISVQTSCLSSLACQAQVMQDVLIRIPRRYDSLLLRATQDEFVAKRSNVLRSVSSGNHVQEDSGSPDHIQNLS
nr:hypothetical protein CFP56_02521 [Quercus suber]